MPFRTFKSQGETAFFPLFIQELAYDRRCLEATKAEWALEIIGTISQFT